MAIRKTKDDHYLDVLLRHIGMVEEHGLDQLQALAFLITQGGSAKVSEIHSSGLNTLTAYGAVEVDGDLAVVVTDKKFGQTPLEIEFGIFVRGYAGKHRSPETEFELLKRKHKDWREVIPKLRTAHRQEQAEHARLIAQSKFCPEFAMLQTWINQRRWESYDVDVMPEPVLSPLYEPYLAWFKDTMPSGLSPMTQEQFLQWKNMEGPFRNLSQLISDFTRRNLITDAHSAYAASPSGKSIYDLIVAAVSIHTKNR